MLVLIKCTITNRFGCNTENVCRFDDDSKDEYIQKCADNLARDNAESYGILDEEQEYCEANGIEFIEDEYYSATYEKLDITEAEAIKKYGEIMEV